tara:strand:+ start:665 stop:1111 length:447 start_codon:yes stop_codon:yes gene_type:complete
MKIIAANSRANFDFLFSDKIDAGIVLSGAEVKSLRLNTGSLRGSYILEKDGELWLSNCFIKKYNNTSDKNYIPNRDRKLLVKRKQINKIIGSLKQDGLSLVPINLYFSNKGLAKLLFGVGKGKKKYDKRQSIKEKDWNIKKSRILKNN